VPSGVLEGKHVWEGELHVDGDVVVARGATLLVKPGTRIFWAPRASWSAAVFRRAVEGHPIETTSREHCDLIVLGTLRVEGDVLFGADDTLWGGITVVERGRIELAGATLGHTCEACIQLFDDAEADLRDFELGHSKTGVWAWGASRARLRRGRIHAVGHGVMAHACAWVRVHDVRFERCDVGCSANERSVVHVDSPRFFDHRGSYARLKHDAWMRFSGGGPLDQGGFVVENRARLERRP
jgi:hypothetical protein